MHGPSVHPKNIATKVFFFSDCVVPENIHTPTTEGIRNSGGVGGQKPRKIQRRGGLNGSITFQRVNFDSFRCELQVSDVGAETK